MDVRMFSPKTMVSCIFSMGLLLSFQKIVAGMMTKLASAKVLNASRLLERVLRPWEEDNLHPVNVP